jgi:hypothetical protein
MVSLTGTRFLIFRQVQDNYRFGQKRYTNPASDHKDPNPATWHHVSSGYQLCHNPVDLTMKANLCCESKNISKNKIKHNSIEVTIVDE